MYCIEWSEHEADKPGGIDYRQGTSDDAQQAKALLLSCGFRDVRVNMIVPIQGR